jgi:hypothetical protein
LLEHTEFAGKVVLFNGSNTDEKCQAIYRAWLGRYKGTDHITGSPTADKRAALVDYFSDEASIMIATEAAAEGINLQFYNLVVTDVLLVDDFAMAPLSDDERRSFLEVCDDRYGRRSSVLTSQLPVESWHAQIGDPSPAS